MPVHCTSNMDAAMILARSMSKGAGCTIMAACMPAKPPRSSRRIFPLALPTSSAGVPITVTVRPDFVGDFGRGERCAYRRCGDDVVAAGVADARQGIVFGADADVQRAGSGTGAERGGQLADALLHGEAGISQ